MSVLLIQSAKKQFDSYKRLVDKVLPLLEEEQLYWKKNPESNSIANIIMHMWGNMLSRWTDFLHSDGEKEWRDRDAEFEDIRYSKAELHYKWQEGWDCVYSALDSLKEEDLTKTIFIRKEPHLALDAILRQLAHYPYHVGQIIYISKIVMGEHWQSLSIPKGKSDEFKEKGFLK